MTTLSNIFYCAGIHAFFTISVLRYHSIKKPLMVISSRIVYGVIAFEMILSILYGSGQIISKLVTPVSVHRAIAPTTMSLFFGSVLFLMLLINILSYKQLKSKICVKRNNSSNPVNVNNISSSATISNKRKLHGVKTLVFMTISNFICNAPMLIFTTVSSVQAFRTESPPADTNVLQVISILYYILLPNTGIHSLIYILRTKEIRQFYLHILSRDKNTTTSR